MRVHGFGVVGMDGCGGDSVKQGGRMAFVALISSLERYGRFSAISTFPHCVLCLCFFLDQICLEKTDSSSYDCSSSPYRIRLLHLLQWALVLCRSALLEISLPTSGNGS